MIVRVGAGYWLISKMLGGNVLDDEAAVQAAIRTGIKLGAYATLQEAAAAMRARTEAGDAS
jgi:hypothetical protein